MSQVTFKGTPVKISGTLPKVGSKAPNFELINASLGSVSLSSFLGKKVVLNIYPSVDTPACAASARKFHERVLEIKDTVLLCISKDLPFAQSRFCATEGLEGAHMLSGYKSPQFGLDYGVLIETPPLDQLYARMVVILDQQHQIIYMEQVSEIANEPNYDKALASL